MGAGGGAGADTGVWLLRLDCGEFLNIVEALMREDLWRMYGADPDRYAEALEDLEERLQTGELGSHAVGLHDPNRDAAWAALGRG